MPPLIDGEGNESVSRRSGDGAWSMGTVNGEVGGGRGSGCSRLLRLVLVCGGSESMSVGDGDGSLGFGIGFVFACCSGGGEGMGRVSGRSSRGYGFCGGMTGSGLCGGCGTDLSGGSSYLRSESGCGGSTLFEAWSLPCCCRRMEYGADVENVCVNC